MDVARIDLPPGALFLDGHYHFEGKLLVSSWVTGRVYRIGRSGTDIETVAQFVSALDNPTPPEGPTDISVAESPNRLLVPLFNAHKLVIISLEDWRAGSRLTFFAITRPAGRNDSQDVGRLLTNRRKAVRNGEDAKVATAAQVVGEIREKREVQMRREKAFAQTVGEQQLGRK